MKGKTRQPLTNTEVWLITLLVLFILISVGLVVFAWIIVKDLTAAGKNSQLFFFFAINNVFFLFFLLEESKCS